MASKTEICNLALGHLGHGKRISNVDTETTPEAIALRLFYDYALESALRDADWPFASKTADLSVVANNPTTEWGFSYRYPADCVKARKILSGTRTDSADTRIPFDEAYDGSGLLIYCTQVNAKLKYTSLLTSVSLYPPDFVMALSYLLASMVAPQISKGDDFKIADRMLQMAQRWMGKAFANAQNEIRQDPEPESEFIRGRY